MAQKAPGKSHREGISLMELADMFPDEASAVAWFEGLIWPNGERHCPRCGCTETTVASATSGLPYYCSGCKRAFSVRIGTALERSKVPLRKWVFAIHLEMTSLKGVSSMKLHRDLKVTQKTAWFMLHRIREAWSSETARLFSGPVEVDETYIEGRRKNMPKAKRKALSGRGAVGKSIVVGTKDRATNRISAAVVGGTDTASLQGFVAERTADRAKVYTDDASAYKGMRFDHEAVNHSAGEYVRGQAHGLSGHRHGRQASDVSGPDGVSGAAVQARAREKNAGPTSTLSFGASHRRGDVGIHYNRAEELYGDWPTPVCIVSDGPYGLSGYPGDLHQANGLADWYRPHIESWTNRSTPETTLWFWNSELGWATVHPVLVANGWEYRACHIWDKGLSHVAGNANTKTLRKFPVTTEVCVQYVKSPHFDGLTMQDWLRHEWRRTGLPFRLANDACGVANAATRKYLTADHLWYFPPPEAFRNLAEYANEHGDPVGRPYFSENGKRPITEDEWSRKRAKFNCSVGVTNVWSHVHLGGAERINGDRQSMRWKFKSLHGSQKPLALIDIIIAACTDPGDQIWEPFGGLCPTAICAWLSGRKSVSAEIVPEFYRAAVSRLSDA